MPIERSPAFVYETETNGVVEKFMHTLMEQARWIERFDTLEQLRHRVRRFAETDTAHWLSNATATARPAKPAPP